MAESGGGGISRVGNRYSSSASEDSLTIELSEVQGYYPMNCEAILGETSVTFNLTSSTPFSELPTLDVNPQAGGYSSHPFASSANGYAVTVPDSLGTAGTFTIWALDDSAAQFFISTRYTITAVDYARPLLEFYGSGYGSRILIDTLNVGMDRVMVHSSSYPVVRTGLDPSAVQAGETHCISLYPDRELWFSRIAIHYSDADMKINDQQVADESSLEIYLWVNAVTGWRPVGASVVDTARNEVWSELPIVGTYAAFTTNIITEVNDDGHGQTLPYRFDLSQNYPNPFNPATTIEYAIPERSHVRIQVLNILGQVVATLVDTELSAGDHTAYWNGVDRYGSSVATGVYLYRFQAGEHVETKKMLLLK
jgi:hypothetical protein